MNWDQIEGDWKRISGLAKEQWGRLIGDEDIAASGKCRRLEGLLQQRYGYDTARAKQAVARWSQTTHR